MRLTNYEINSIKYIFKDIFKSGNISLFGSRVDETKKGGDIDLYIELNEQLSVKDMLDKKSKFRLKLYDKIGEQKIDVIISKDKSRLIEQEVIKNKITL